MTDPTNPPGSEPTLPDATLPGAPTPRPVPPDAPTWSDGPPTFASAPLPGADPTSLYPAAPPTAPPVAPPPLPPVGGAGAGDAPVGPDPTPWPYGARGTAAGSGRNAVGIVLLFVAGIAAVSSLAAAWTRQQIKDEDTWAATAQALADDAAVQQAVADVLAAQVIGLTGADDVISGLLPGPLGVLADPLTAKATDLVSVAALELVQTEAFRNAWEVAVRNSHQELLAAIDGNGRITTISPEGIELDLGSTLEQFRLLLDDKGLTFLDSIDLSGVDVQFLLVDAPGLLKLRDTLEVLDGMVMLSPLVAAVCLVAGLLIARRRSWAVVAGGLGVMVGAGAVVVLAAVGRGRAEQEFTGGVLGPAAVEVVADEVVSSLQSLMLVAGIVGIAIVLLGTAGVLVSARRAI